MNPLIVEKSGARSQKYTIPGDPVPLARARHGNRRTWDSQKDLKRVSSIFLQGQHEGPLFEGPLSFEVIFYLSMPIKTKKKESQLHVFKPDLSNMIKFVEDIGTGIIYHDDCLICSISAMKMYSRNPRTEIIVTQITNGK